MTPSKLIQTNFQRLFLIAALLGVISWQYTVGKYVPIIFPSIIILIYVYEMISIGNVLPALKATEKSDYSKADKLLKSNLNPSWLKLRVQGLYWFIKGNVESNLHSNNELAKQHYERCVALGINVQNAAAFGYLGLATVCIKQKQYEEALAMIKETETCKVDAELSLLLLQAKENIMKKDFSFFGV